MVHVFIRGVFHTQVNVGIMQYGSVLKHALYIRRLSSVLMNKVPR